jgi:hypothetical protein
MLKLNNKLIVLLCDFLRDKEKATILRGNQHFFYKCLPNIFFTEPMKIPKIHFYKINYNCFTNIIFDVGLYMLPANIQYVTGRYVYVQLLISCCANVKYIDSEKDNNEKITVSFIKPARKTKFKCVNVNNRITYCGSIDKFDVQSGAVSKYLIAKFYMAHDDLDRFRKVLNTISVRRIIWEDHELFLHAALMQPMPTKIFSYILNETTSACVPRFVKFMLYIVELEIPRDIWKMIVNMHIDMFWNRIYDLVSDD